jgi:mRNA-degrading endonuclease RelE of RelBE toxin-antitoxin system
VVYRIVYSPEAEDHLRALPARNRMLLLDSVEEQWVHQPTEETRNRKRLRPNLLAPWELRVGDLRAYYDIEDDPDPDVHMRAVGIKDHNVLWIGGRRFSL